VVCGWVGGGANRFFLCGWLERQGQGSRQAAFFRLVNEQQDEWCMSRLTPSPAAGGGLTHLRGCSSSRSGTIGIAPYDAEAVL